MPRLSLQTGLLNLCSTLRSAILPLKLQPPRPAIAIISLLRFVPIPVFALDLDGPDKPFPRFLYLAFCPEYARNIADYPSIIFGLPESITPFAFRAGRGSVQIDNERSIPEVGQS